MKKQKTIQKLNGSEANPNDNGDEDEEKTYEDERTRTKNPFRRSKR